MNQGDSVGKAMLDFMKSPVRNYRKFRSLYRFDDIGPGAVGGPSE